MSFLGAAAAAIGGAALNSGQSLLGSWFQGRQNSKASGRQYKYASRLAEEADERALSNAKSLFNYQNTQGAKQLMEGYRKAGLNPVLAGDFNANMPSFSSHAGSVDVEAPDVSKSFSIGSIIDDYMRYKQMEAQTNMLDTNAKAVAERVELDKQRADAANALNWARTATETQMPAKVKAEVQRTNEQIILNQLQRDLVQSRTNLNAAMIRDVESRIGYRRDVARAMSHKSYIGLPWGIARLYGSALDELFGPEGRGPSVKRMLEEFDRTPEVRIKVEKKAR